MIDIQDNGDKYVCARAIFISPVCDIDVPWTNI